MQTKKSKRVIRIDVDDLIDQALVLGSSLVYLAKDSADGIISELEKRQLLSSKEGKKMAEDIRNNFTKRKNKLHSKIKESLRGVIDDLGIATKEDLKKIKVK